MYTAYIVTHRGPCLVTEDLFQSITKKKILGISFSDQILFALEVDVEGLEFATIKGKIPLIQKLEDFEAKFLMDDPPVIRAIGL
jgi:hypothetical protein